MDPYSLGDHAHTTDEGMGTTWNPDRNGTGSVDVGAKLAGEVVGFRLLDVSRGGEVQTVPIMHVLAADDGILYTVWINADLNRALSERGVQRGDQIYLEYAGTVDLDGGKRVKRYRVAAARNGQILSIQSGGDSYDAMPSQADIAVHREQATRRAAVASGPAGAESSALVDQANDDVPF
jgi:hypothetical protein